MLTTYAYREQRSTPCLTTIVDSRNHSFIQNEVTKMIFHSFVKKKNIHVEEEFRIQLYSSNTLNFNNLSYMHVYIDSFIPPSYTRYQYAGASPYRTSSNMLPVVNTG
mmetsp:Transcript_1114/g.1281  ORF Transcript_1114/g.1281 Transcript_1114/m.1281 type:complete len:107 (+) Transcript_1114:1043-1363(+)